MDYRLPEFKDKEIINEYVKETHAANEKSVTASDGFTKIAYEEWVNMIHNDFKYGNEKLGKRVVLLCFEEEKLIGLLSIRINLPDDLLSIYGNVGYSVRPSERKKGYATKILSDAKTICKNYGMKQIILGAVSSNIASIKTIEKNGGVLFEKSYKYKSELTYYYKIDL